MWASSPTNCTVNFRVFTDSRKDCPYEMHRKNIYIRVRAQPVINSELRIFFGTLRTAFPTNCTVKFCVFTDNRKDCPYEMHRKNRFKYRLKRRHCADGALYYESYIKFLRYQKAKYFSLCFFILPLMNSSVSRAPSTPQT